MSVAALFAPSFVRPPRRITGWIFFAVALSVVAGVVLLKSMTEPLDRDEHQFVASGVLLARHSLLPYRDFPYFHMPYLVFLYAGLFRGTLHPLMTARLASAACGFLTVAMTMGSAYTACRGCTRRVQWSVTLVIVLLLLTNPLYAHASGRTWNHDVPEALVLGATLLILRRTPGRQAAIAMASAGMLMGIAVGVRLTVAPLILPLAAFIYSDRSPSDSRAYVRTLCFALGIVIALVPATVMFLKYRQGFFFGNFEYPRAVTMYWRAAQHGGNATPLAKLKGLAGVVFVPGTILLILLAALVWLAARGACRGILAHHPHRREFTIFRLLVIYWLIGALAPTPVYKTYFYALVPFFLLLLVYLAEPALRQLHSIPRIFQWLAVGLLIAIVLLGLPGLARIEVAFTPAQWTPIQVHRLGMELRAACGPADNLRPVLTLVPIYPLEGNLDVYEQYATGPFALRVAPYVDSRKHAELKLLDEGDLVLVLHSQPPGSMLIGIEENLEMPMRAAATDLACPRFTIARRGKDVHIVAVDRSSSGLRPSTTPQE